MNNSTVNFTSPEASNSTTKFIGILDSLNICAYTVAFLFGLPTHSYIIWLIITGRESRVASEFFILNLFVCEIGNCVNSLFYIVSICLQSIRALPLFLLGLVFTGRPLFQCLMCVERYLAVVHPVTFLKYKPLRYRVICCSITLYNHSLLLCFVLIYKSDTYKVLIGAILAGPLHPVVLSCGCSQSSEAVRNREKGRERKEENHMKRKAFLIILINTVTTTVIYAPFTIAGLISILMNLYINAIWVIGQPVLYLHRAGKLSCL